VRRNALYTILALAVLALSAVPVGVAVFVLGFVYGDSPCVMCWEQRIGMALIALVGLFVLRYGPKPKYVGMAVLVAAWGVFMGMRHTGMHAARDVGQGFSIEILGAHTYTWALCIYGVCVATMGVLLLLMRREDIEDRPRTLRPLESLAGAVFLLVIAGNIVQAFASTGPPPYMGQGDPVRFSFNPTHWVWSLEEWSPAPVSLRGRWSIDKPAPATLPGDASAGPIAGPASLVPAGHAKIGFPVKGTLTDLAYDEASRQFLVTTEQGIYLADEGLSRVTRYTIVDVGYSVDLGRFGGAAFLDKGRVMAVGENKSYVVLEPNDKADANANFRYFLESFDRFTETARGRFGTVRARMMYVRSAAYDPASRSVFTVTVPNNKVKRLTVSRFGPDFTLSEEFVPALGDGPGLTLAGKRTLDEYYVTGAAVADGRLYALSAAYNTLLAIDLAKRSVVAAYAVPGIARPVGLAVKGHQFVVLGESGAVWVFGVPQPVTAP
jgi:disulfide bond formation protein DsbB